MGSLPSSLFFFKKRGTCQSPPASCVWGFFSFPLLGLLLLSLFFSAEFELKHLLPPLLLLLLSSRGSSCVSECRGLDMNDIEIAMKAPQVVRSHDLTSSRVVSFPLSPPLQVYPFFCWGFFFFGPN